MRRLSGKQIGVAQKNALRFPFLYQFLDWESILMQLTKSTVETVQVDRDNPFNIIEALLMVNNATHFSAYDPNSNLQNIESSLTRLFPILSEKDKVEIKRKLSNIGNTSFWDTASELWFASQLKGNNFDIKFDFPLRETKRGFLPPNADVAIVDSNNEPIWLFDCIAPTLELEECKGLKIVGEDDFYDEPQEAINCLVAIIKNKFEKKFLPHTSHYPNARYGIIVTLIKADDISAHFLTLNLLKRTPLRIDSSKLHPKLNFAVVGRFQETGDQIEFVQLLKHEAE